MADHHPREMQDATSWNSIENTLEGAKLQAPSKPNVAFGALRTDMKSNTSYAHV